MPAAENVPLARRRRRTRFITVYIWLAVLLLPVALLTIFLLGAQQLRAGNADDSGTAAGSQGAALAQLEVERWIAQRPSPLPGGRVILFTGARTAAAEPANPGDPAAPLTTYEFLVTDRSRNLFTTTVQMVSSPQSGTVPVAQPALVPLPPSDPGAAPAPWPWPGVEPGAVSAGYQPAVAAWARAYTSGDPVSLKQVVGDPQQGRSYMPLTGVTFGEISIQEVGNLWADGQNRGEDSQPTQALLRVSVRAAWDGEPVVPGTRAPALTFDLLLDRADTAAPVVVAWGSPGMQLSPYGNAVEGRTLAGSGPPAPKPTATPT